MAQVLLASLDDPKDRARQVALEANAVAHHLTGPSWLTYLQRAGARQEQLRLVQGRALAGNLPELVPEGLVLHTVQCMGISAMGRRLGGRFWGVCA